MTELLTQSIKLGSMESKNPFMGAPINIRPFSESDGSVTEKDLALYEEYGKTGLGVLVTGAANVSRECASYTPSLGVWEDNQVEGLSLIAERMKAQEGLAILQIAHRGFQHLGIDAFCDVNPEECIRIQTDFVKAAIRAKKADFDGVELHACHGYLLNQVISPITNNCNWQYGGSLESRVAYITEIIDMIRSQCGSDFIIGIRMGCNDPDLETSQIIAKLYEVAGADYLSVSAGISEPFATGKFDDNISLGIDVPQEFPFCKRVFGAWMIKEKVSIPVACVGDLCTRDDVVDILESGYADLVAIGRARLADPKWFDHILKDEQTYHCLQCKKCSWFTKPEKCPGRKLLGFDPL